MISLECLNLCELLPYLLKKYKDMNTIIENSMKLSGFTSLERIYVGTSFCGKYFLHQSMEQLNEITSNKDQKLTLVIPPFSQGDLEQGKQKINKILELCGNCLDEITVND